MSTQVKIPSYQEGLKDLQDNLAKVLPTEALTIFGNDAKYIVAKYTPQNGKEKTSLLLLSGYWGIARHFHYLPEILCSIFWCIPAGFEHFLPHFYYLFLIVLLCDRSVRDEGRCTNKYGKYYLEYKNQVPYKIIPGLF